MIANVEVLYHYSQSLIGVEFLLYRKKGWRINLHCMLLFVVNINTVEPWKGSVSWDLQRCSVCDPAKMSIIYKVNTCEFGSAKWFPPNILHKMKRLAKGRETPNTCCWLARYFDWSTWVASRIRSLTFCNPSFSFMGDVGEKVNN
jgi:hypothetical protein